MAARRTSLLAGLLGAAAVAVAGFVIAMRTKYPPVMDRVRQFNRDVNNPRQLRTAGQPDAFAAIIHHVGRTSGMPYQTPVVPVPTDDGFVIPLPYGPTSDWVCNVLAAGGADITHEGAVIAVTSPRLQSLDQVRHSLPGGDQRVATLFGVRDFLEVTSA